MVETKALSSKLSESQLKEAKKKQFRKLHIVSVIDQVGPLYLKTKKSKDQQLEQIDQLTISEQTSKFVSYDYKRGIVFMLNREK